VFSNKVAEAIREASVREDYHYLLAYAPQDPSGSKERKIEVKVGRKDVDVISLKQYVAPGGPVISIVDFKSGQKAIRFGLRDYARIPTEGKTVGSAASGSPSSTTGPSRSSPTARPWSSSRTRRRSL
jgi:hypothetical protein